MYMDHFFSFSPSSHISLSCKSSKPGLTSNFVPPPHFHFLFFLYLYLPHSYSSSSVHICCCLLFLLLVVRVCKRGLNPLRFVLCLNLASTIASTLCCSLMHKIYPHQQKNRRATSCMAIWKYCRNGSKFSST